MKKGACRLYPLPRTVGDDSLLNHFCDFFAGAMYLLRSSWLFSGCHSVEARPLRTVPGLCCTYSSSSFGPRTWHVSGLLCIMYRGPLPEDLTFYQSLPVSSTVWHTLKVPSRIKNQSGIIAPYILGHSFFPFVLNEYKDHICFVQCFVFQT